MLVKSLADEWVSGAIVLKDGDLEKPFLGLYSIGYAKEVEEKSEENGGCRLICCHRDDSTADSDEHHVGLMVAQAHCAAPA